MRDKFFLYIVSVFVSLFSTAIMSYISMATPIGPWIETTLVLFCMILFGLFRPKMTGSDYQSSLGLATASGSIGGILATGFGFSIPTLYFIAPDTFNLWLSKPLMFVLYLGFLAFSAGSFGLLVALFFEKQLIQKEQLSFAVGELVYKMISVKDQVNKAIMLAWGFIVTKVLLILQFSFNLFSENITILSSRAVAYFVLPKISLPFDLLPMLLAIGFVTGHVIAVPLFVGVLSKIFCVDPLNGWYPEISSGDFILAFCSGIVIFNAVIGFIFSVPKFTRSVKKLLLTLRGVNAGESKLFGMIGFWDFAKAALVISFNVLFFSYFNFSFLSQIYILVFTFICTYQLLVIAGKTGIAPLGRFATFVLFPGMLLFGFDPVQITFISTFVEVAGGVGCDVLFGQKMAHLASIDRKRMVMFQWLGLLVSSVAIGFIFWLLISKFGLGTQLGALPVTKASARALMINLKSFDLTVLLFGAVFGYVLSLTKINSMLVLGGILTPPSWSLILILGSLLTYLVKDREEYYPFWSGVFAANSLWMLLKAFFVIL